MKMPWTKTAVLEAETEPTVESTPFLETVEEQKKRLAPPFPSSHEARTPKLNSEEMEEYIRISSAVGIDCCTDLIREKLLKCLREENIHIFNENQVVAYLDDKLGKDWEWRGLRTADVEHLSGWHTNSEQRRVDFASEPYRGAVPLPVLLTIQKVQAAVPEVFFYVSAPKDKDGDPFLAVTSRHLSMYIIERWNEPNFRER